MTLILACGMLRAQEQRHEISIMGAGGVGTMNYRVVGGDNPFRLGGQLH
ncbi:MAG: hypothetical protein LBU95_01260 [Rikenellaceae bacterium]|nr:hypothetical protein [Rikenellaceae bacterium]